MHTHHHLIFIVIKTSWTSLMYHSPQNRITSSLHCIFKASSIVHFVSARFKRRRPINAITFYPRLRLMQTVVSSKESNGNDTKLNLRDRLRQVFAPSSSLMTQSDDKFIERQKESQRETKKTKFFLHFKWLKIGIRECGRGIRRLSSSLRL